MASDKKEYRRAKYIDNIKNYREVYEERKEFLKDWSTPIYREEAEVMDKQESASNGDGGDVEGGTPPSGGGEGEDARGLIALAKTKMKAPYVFGAKGPNTFDCSGFVYWVCAQKGATFGRNTAAGFHSMFTKIDNPVPGDIVFFSNTYKNGISHIGFYMGGDKFIHTADVNVGVEIASLESKYWKSHFTDIRRIPDKYWGNSAGSGKSSVKEMTLSEEETIGDYGVEVPEHSRGSTTIEPDIVYMYEPIVRTGGHITIKNTREEFLRNRIGWAREGNYESFVSLNKEKFIHFTSVGDFEGNLYSPDAKKLFEDLLLKTKKPYFEVISGFRFGREGYLSPHEAGCAIDIKVEKIDEARELADCAWQLGIRAIAFGGSFKEKTAYVHIDIAPAEKRWSYGTLPVYNGPGNWIYDI